LRARNGEPIFHPAFTSVADQARLVAAGELTATQLVNDTLERIDQLNPTLHAFLRVFRAASLAEAAALDEFQRREGRTRGPLHGVPIAIKDENDVVGDPTTYGGAAVTTLASADSEIVRLLREAGAVIIGKTAMPEFGIWPFTESQANGYTHNPWDLNRSTAGSSGGTAAAVASGMVAAGIGGDGGGSIRLPASYCGLYGLKPSRGRVSASPNAELWRSLGTTGPLTRTVLDSALLYDVISGTTTADRWSAPPLARSLVSAVTAPFVPLRIAVSFRNPAGGAKADAETRAAISRTAHALRALGHHVVAASPTYPNATAAFVPQLVGGVADEAVRVDHPELLEQRTRGLLTIGRVFAGHRVGRWAERHGEKISAQVNTFFDDFDLLLMPTTPSAALPIGQLDGAGTIAAMAKALPVSSFTSLWNVVGNPAAAIPTGFTPGGLPLSAQLVGRVNDEFTVVQVSAQLEAAQPWTGRRPAISAPSDATP
jgi:amidase